MTPPSPSRRAAALRTTAVNAILAQVRALQAEGRSLISLMRGEPDFATPAHIVEAAAKSLRDGRTRYPNNQGEPALREAVAEKLERETGHHYLLLNTPWNPTGTVLRREELASVAALAERRKEEEEGQPERNSSEKKWPL
jgi:aspartate/methionine/tyrosine aminotransferase